jgi:hypothetical protein
VGVASHDASRRFSGNAAPPGRPCSAGRPPFTAEGAGARPSYHPRFHRRFPDLHFIGPCVTVFGSARYGESHPYYAVGREVGRALAAIGFTVMTGGGPGLMEAANRGAHEAGSEHASRDYGTRTAAPDNRPSRRSSSAWFASVRL